MKSMRQSIGVGMIGNALEWYDFSLYGYFSPVLAKLFFPTSDPTTSLVSTFAIFAAGFLMRPLGALFFGGLGDRLGRKKALIFSLLLVALPTVLIGFLPTYSQIGIWAPILLAILRMIQGFSVGGEYSSSIIFLTENASPNRRGFAGSFALFGSGIGWLLGSLASAITTQTIPTEALYSWGWRLPFLFGALAALYGVFLRSKIVETAEFTELQETKALASNPLSEVWSQQKMAMGRLIGFNLLSTVAGYLLYAYMPSYLNKVAKMPLSDALYVNTLALLLFNLLVPLAGLLSDIVGRRKLFLIGATGFVLFSYPLFVLLEMGFGYALVAMGIFTVFIALYHGPLPAAMAEQFPARIRASAVGVCYNFAASFFSGTCPLTATLLVEKSGNPQAPAFYLLFVGAVSLVCVLLSKREEKVLASA